VSYEEPYDIGDQLGIDATERSAYCAERYCGHERDRIALVNQPRIIALHVEARTLTVRKSRLETRLRAMPEPGDVRSAKRRMWYYTSVRILLILAAFALTAIGLAPYRLDQWEFCISSGSRS
jgi:hypothetical protein